MSNQTIESGQRTIATRQISMLMEEQMDIPKELFDIYGDALVRLIVINPFDGKEVSDTLYDPKDYTPTDQ